MLSPSHVVRTVIACRHRVYLLEWTAKASRSGRSTLLHAALSAPPLQPDASARLLASHPPVFSALHL